MRNHSWQHYLPEKLAKLKCFYPNQMATKRGFQHSNPLWLGPTLLARTVFRLYHTLRHVYYIYRTQRHITSIYTHFHLQLRGVSTLPQLLLQRFPELQSNLHVAGQKRKRFVVNPDAEEHSLIDVTLQGASGARYVAILCWYDDDRASWLALNKQSADVQSWWAITVEERYPLLPNEYQVPLVLDRTGSFSRSNSS